MTKKHGPYIERLRTTVRTTLSNQDQALAIALLDSLDSGINPIKGFIHILETGNNEQRNITVWLLGQLGDNRASPILLKTFLDQHLNIDLRQQAAISLSGLGSKLPVRRLISAMLNAEELVVREKSAYVLGWLYDDRAIDPLMEVLEREAEVISVRAQAAESLGHLRLPQTKKAEPTLINALQDKSAEVRFWSAFALAELGTVQALPALKRLAADTTEVVGWGTVSQEAKEAVELIEARQKISNVNNEPEI